MAKKAYGTTGSRCTRFEGPLTPKEQRFCEEYVKDFNATQAVIRGNLASEGAAARCGSVYLKKEHVRAYIDELRGRMAEKATIERDDLLQFWAGVMDDPNESTPNRLKASDYLGKALGVFTLKVETQQAPTIIMDLAPPTLPVVPEPLTIEASVDVVVDEEDDDIDYENYSE